MLGDVTPRKGEQAEDKTSAPMPPVGAMGPLQGDADMSQNLTPEEQMAQFERELKEKDWGHQPC